MVFFRDKAQLLDLNVVIEMTDRIGDLSTKKKK